MSFQPDLIQPAALSLDLDGVLFDLMTPTCVRAYTDLGILIEPEDIQQYDVAKVLRKAARGAYHEDSLWPWLRGLWFEEAGFMRQAPVHAAIWVAVQHYRRRGGENAITIRTARMDHGALAEAETYVALTNCGLGMYRPVGKNAEAVLARSARGRLVHVEDCFEDALGLLEGVPDESFEVWLIERPWNRDRPRPSPEDGLRLHCGTEAEVAAAIRSLRPTR